MLQCLRRIGLVMAFASTALAQDVPPAEAGAEPVPAAKGQVYRSVDAQGHVIYTDAPPAGRAAEEVRIAPVNTVPAAISPGDQQQSEKQKQKSIYERFTITSPQNDAVLGQESDAIEVVVELSPPLQSGDSIQFYFDGRPLGEPGQSLGYTISPLERGTHTVEAKLLDAKGDMVMSTGIVQFHVRRISALNKVSDNKPEKPQGWLGRWWGRDASAVADVGPGGGYGSPKGAGGTSGIKGPQAAGAVTGMPGMGGPADRPK